MLKDLQHLRSPDPYFAGTAGFVGSTLDALHRDMSENELPDIVPEAVRRAHDGVRHAYIYSYFSYDLLTLAAGATFPCLEFALRLRLGEHIRAPQDKNGKSRIPTLGPLLGQAKKDGLFLGDIETMTRFRNMFAHGSGVVINPPLFLRPFELVTLAIRDLYERPLIERPSAPPPTPEATYERARRLGSQAVWTITLQHGRLKGGEPEEREFMFRRLADFQFLIVALTRLHRAVGLAATIPTVADELNAALQEFDEAVPKLKKMRDTLEHIDEYAVDQGHDKDVSRRNLEVAAFSDTVLQWLDCELNADTALLAAEELFQALKAAQNTLISRRDTDGLVL
jgi:hypothetical protein